MQLKKLIGIGRGNEFSPNHVDNDAAILRAVADALQQQGCEVQLIGEREFLQQPHLEADLMFNMVRSHEAIAALKACEDRGIPVVNSAYGIDNCVRRPMTEMLLAAGVSYPESWIVDTAAPLPADVVYPCWIKRGEQCAMVKEDVSYVNNPKEARAVLDHFRHRGIPVAVINRHLFGDLIKFYGVSGTDFFYWFYPSDLMHSKFGLEEINGPVAGIPFCDEALKRLADAASEVLRVPIYGGDCVVTPEGELYIIDFNDWPSFARCRDEAAPSIAECILQHLQK